MCKQNWHKVGVQNEYNFHFSGSKGGLEWHARRSIMMSTCVRMSLCEEQGKINPAQVYVICGSSCWYFGDSAICSTQKGQSLWFLKKRLGQFPSFPALWMAVPAAVLVVPCGRGRSKRPAPRLLGSPAGVMLALFPCSLPTWVPTFSVLQWLFSVICVYPANPVIHVCHSDLVSILLLCWGLTEHCGARSVPSLPLPL